MARIHKIDDGHCMHNDRRSEEREKGLAGEKIGKCRYFKEYVAKQKLIDIKKNVPETLNLIALELERIKTLLENSDF